MTAGKAFHLDFSPLWTRFAQNIYFKWQTKWQIYQKSCAGRSPTAAQTAPLLKKKAGTRKPSESTERTGDSNTYGIDRLCAGSTSTARPDHHLSGLRVWMALTDSQACDPALHSTTTQTAYVGGDGDNRLQTTNIHIKRLDSSHQVADEIMHAFAIFTGYREILSMIEAFLTCIGHTNMLSGVVASSRLRSLSGTQSSSSQKVFSSL